MKPIEPGCLALIINAPANRIQFAGKIVKVVRFIGESPAKNALPRNDYWEVEAIDFILPDEFAPHASESVLMRIDPDDEIKSETRKEKGVEA